MAPWPLVLLIKLTEKDGAVRFEVHAKPRAKKSRIVGARADGLLEVALAAPPVDGAANEELVRVLAAAFGVPRRQIQIVRGETGQRKLIAVTGLALDAVEAGLAGLGSSPADGNKT